MVLRRGLTILLSAALVPAAWAGDAAPEPSLRPVREYAPVGKRAEVEVHWDGVSLPAAVGSPRAGRGGSPTSEASDPGPAAQAAPTEVVLFDAWGAELGRHAVVEPSGEGGGAVLDLLEAFPILGSTPPARAVKAGLRRGNVGIGSGVVVVPMWSAPRYESALTAVARRMLRARSVAEFESMLPGLRGRIEALDREVRGEGVGGGGGADGVGGLGEPERVFSGYRLIVDRRVRIRTSLGEMEFALRFDAAPGHAAAFLRLVEGGFYDGSAIFRIGLSGVDGRPLFIQAGDPTGTGLGGNGERVAYEPSTLERRAGTLALARAVGDPNSASTQIVITLADDAAGETRDGATASGELVRGAGVLRALAEVPVGPRVPEVPGSPRDLPLADLVIERAWTVPARVGESAPVPEAEPEPEAVER